MSNNIEGKRVGTVALAIIAVAAIVIAVSLLTSPTVSGGVSCLFYSADSKTDGYTICATLSNNSTSPVTVERVYLDGAEQNYSATILANDRGIWSMEVGDQPTKVLGVANVGTLLVQVVGINPDFAHTVRVVTNTSSFEFSVDEKLSSLTFDHYDYYQAPGIDYLTAYLGNSGTAFGHVVKVAIDGVVYNSVYNATPPKGMYKWSILVEGNPTAFIGVGQQGLVYIDTSGICHSCIHTVKISCSDGSYVEFSFRPG